MAKKEFVCFECDSSFVIKTDNIQDVRFCPSCSEPFALEEANDFEDEDQE